MWSVLVLLSSPAVRLVGEDSSGTRSGLIRAEISSVYETGSGKHRQLSFQVSAEDATRSECLFESEDVRGVSSLQSRSCTTLFAVSRGFDAWFKFDTIDLCSSGYCLVLARPQLVWGSGWFHKDSIEKKSQSEVEVKKSSTVVARLCSNEKFRKPNKVVVVGDSSSAAEENTVSPLAIRRYSSFCRTRLRSV